LEVRRENRATAAFLCDLPISRGSDFLRNVNGYDFSVAECGKHFDWLEIVVFSPNFFEVGGKVAGQFGKINTLVTASSDVGGGRRFERSRSVP